MNPNTFSLEEICLAKRLLYVVFLVLFWTWETWQPFFGQGEGRWKHAAKNLTLALLNTILLQGTFAALTIIAADWAEENRLGLLNLIPMTDFFRWVFALVLLDGWMYLWHRANHEIPFLWCFHRMHHSDRNMDVTTATRFHLGEHILSSMARLAFIPLLGLNIRMILAYDVLLLAAVMFHHADISLGCWDQRLRWFMVTPDMHKIHHSSYQPETDSNYATILSLWDRLGNSYRMRSDPGKITFGLEGFSTEFWQTWWGMWRTPFQNRKTG